MALNLCNLTLNPGRFSPPSVPAHLLWLSPNHPQRMYRMPVCPLTEGNLVLKRQWDSSWRKVFQISAFLASASVLICTHLLFMAEDSSHSCSVLGRSHVTFVAFVEILRPHTQEAGFTWTLLTLLALCHSQGPTKKSSSSRGPDSCLPAGASS